MNKFIVTIVAIFFLSSSLLFSQTGWYLQTSPTTKNLMDVFFINLQTGWACGDSGRVLKTTNGGTNWVQKITPTPHTLRAIRFSDANNGYAAGGESYYNPFCIDYSVILKTTNGGENWVYPPTAYDPWDIYYDVAVLNKDTVFASYAGTDNYCMSSSGGMYRTINGGSNWNQFGGGWMKGISFINQSTGWATTFAIGDVMIGQFGVFKTTNTGENWNLVYFDTTWGGSSIGKIRFTDTNNGYTLKNMLRKTTNGGINWQKIDSVTTYYLRSFAPANKDTLWIIRSNNFVCRTNNSGTNWTQQLTPGTALNSIYFFDNNTGWIAGNNGIIYKTITGGVTGVQYISTEIPPSYSLGQNYPNPFNPSTVVRFQLSVVSNVVLKVYDVMGREVQTLVNERLQAGTYETTFDVRHVGSSRELTSGVYFYRMVVRHGGSSTDGFTETRRMLLVK